MVQSFVRYDWSISTLLILSILLKATSASLYRTTETKDRGLPAKYLIGTYDKAGEKLRCSMRCIAMCHCLSFEIANQVCELYNSSKVLNEAEMIDKPGSMSYVLEKFDNMAQCVKETSFEEISCCLQLQPCKNGGTCIAADPLKTGRRYKCLCKSHTKGVHCETVTPANFCQDKLNTSKKDMGWYNHPNGEEVLCDLQDGIVWTRVMWCWPDACGKFISLSKNYPISRKRLSLELMKDIQKASRLWKVQCVSFPYGYFIGLNSQLDILSDHSTHCVPVEEYQIGEEKCVTSSTNQCKIQATQEGGKMLYFTLDSICSSGITNSGGTTLKCGKDRNSVIYIFFGV